MTFLKSAAAIAMGCVLTYAPPAAARGGTGAAPDGEPRAAKLASEHTVTWWCVDLNDLYHVDVPVIAPRVMLVAPVDPGIPVCDETSFPVTVPADSPFVVGSTGWGTNKGYPDFIRDELATRGVPILDSNPMEDFMRKLVEIRIVISATPTSGLVDPIAVYSFDPRSVFRRFELRKEHGAALAFFDTPDATLIAAGLTSAEEVGRIPMVWFPAVVGPVAPGAHRGIVILVLSDWHNDGLGLDDGNFLAPGDNILAATLFTAE